MNIKLTSISSLLFTASVLVSCEQKKDTPIQTDPVKPKETVELPVQMIKSPDGHYYFPNNYMRPKSDRDTLVWVKPSEVR